MTASVDLDAQAPARRQREPAFSTSRRRLRADATGGIASGRDDTHASRSMTTRLRVPPPGARCCTGAHAPQLRRDAQRAARVRRRRRAELRDRRGALRAVSADSRGRSVARAREPRQPRYARPARARTRDRRSSAARRGEQRSGGAERPSILADALEAMLRRRLHRCRLRRGARVVERVYAAELRATRSPATLAKDPKTRLQEWLQARRTPVPEYAVTAVAGEAHAQTFTVECRIPSLAIVVSGQRPEPARGRAGCGGAAYSIAVAELRTRPRA